MRGQRQHGVISSPCVKACVIFIRQPSQPPIGLFSGCQGGTVVPVIDTISPRQETSLKLLGPHPSTADTSSSPTFSLSLNPFTLSNLC